MDKTVVKSLRIVEALGRSERPRGISDLARELGLGNSNVHRLLSTLVQLGFVRRYEDEGKYELTLKLWEIGVSAIHRLDVRETARTHMEWLAENTRETVHLSTLYGGEVIYIDKIESMQAIRAYSRIGGKAPAYCVATGKALLSEMTNESVLAACPTLTKFTEKTHKSHASLFKELDEVRRNGFAINSGEWRLEVCGAGAVIRNERNEGIAAVGISGPAERLKPRLLRRLAADSVVEAARRISAALGCQNGQR